MKQTYLTRLTFLILIVSLLSVQNSYGQRLKKVRASKKIVAYDVYGNVIDSLTKDLKNQADASRYLDQIQVELRKIELELQRAGDDSKKTASSQKRKEELLAEKLDLIKQIQENKTNRAKEYYIVIESFKSKGNAKNALEAWHNKGYTAFLFQNKVRKWYYICGSVQRSYTNAIRKQYQFQKEGVDSWIYYWAE